MNKNTVLIKVVEKVSQSFKTVVKGTGLVTSVVAIVQLSKHNAKRKRVL